MTVPDLSALTPIQFVGVLVIVALFDFVTGIYGAIHGQAFDPNKVLDILFTHGVQRIAPIAALFAMGYVAASQPFVLLADAALGAYIAETVISVAGNIGAKP